MMRATASFNAPSTVSCPLVLELMIGSGEPLVYAHPGPTTYQSGSPDASTSWSVPMVRQGKRPTFGSEQFPAAWPSVPAASGQGRAPGRGSADLAACAAT